MTPLLAPIRIVLVEPAGMLNLGSIARIMKNMGLRQLVLVNPQCDHLAPEARQMAVHAADVLAGVQVVATLPEALVGCQRAIATAVRTRSVDTPLEHPRVALPWLVAEKANSTQQSALIFGAEDRGLSNEELKYAQRFVYIPSSPDYVSLNLAQAVAICCYELAQAVALVEGSDANQKISDPPLPFTPPPGQGAPLVASAAIHGETASLDALEGYYQQLEDLLLTIGYLYPHTAPSRMEKFRRLFNRAYPTDTEVAMLRGVLSQMTWALTRGRE
jgi:tRNA/rRNA methyltransferase